MEPVNVHMEFRITVYLRFRNDDPAFNPTADRAPYMAFATKLHDDDCRIGLGHTPREAILDAMLVNEDPQPVFLLWDNTRQQKGEGSELVDVFESFEVAEAEKKKLIEAEGLEDDEDAAEDYSIEKKEVRSA